MTTKDIVPLCMTVMEEGLGHGATSPCLPKISLAPAWKIRQSEDGLGRESGGLGLLHSLSGTALPPHLALYPEKD